MAQKQKVVKGKVYNWDDKSKMWFYQYDNPAIKDGIYEKGGVPKAKSVANQFAEALMSPGDIEIAQSVGRHLGMGDMPENAGSWMKGAIPAKPTYATPERLRPVGVTSTPAQEVATAPVVAPAKPVAVVEPVKPVSSAMEPIPPIATISQEDWQGVNKIVQDKIKEVGASARHPWEPSMPTIGIIPAAPAGATIPRFKSKSQVNAELDAEIDDRAKQIIAKQYAPKKAEALVPRPALISTPASMKQTDVVPSNYAKEMRSRYAQALAGQYGSTSSTSSSGSLM